MVLASTVADVNRRCWGAQRVIRTVLVLIFSEGASVRVLVIVLAAGEAPPSASTPERRGSQAPSAPGSVQERAFTGQSGFWGDLQATYQTQWGEGDEDGDGARSWR